MGWLRKRLGEGNTHAGIAALLLVAGSFFPQYKPILDGVALIFGGGAVVMPEQKD